MASKLKIQESLFYASHSEQNILFFLGSWFSHAQECFSDFGTILCDSEECILK